MKGNLRLIGRNFEIEAFEILKNMFDNVEWSSEQKHSYYDFKCLKDNKTYLGDAKLISFGKKPVLSFNQSNIDFVIAKIKGNISIIWKDEFKNKINIKKNFITSHRISKYKIGYSNPYKAPNSQFIIHSSFPPRNFCNLSFNSSFP